LIQDPFIFSFWILGQAQNDNILDRHFAHLTSPACLAKVGRRGA
jgi:hypothetical protein